MSLSCITWSRCWKFMAVQWLLFPPRPKDRYLRSRLVWYAASNYATIQGTRKPAYRRIVNDLGWGLRKEDHDRTPIFFLSCGRFFIGGAPMENRRLLCNPFVISHTYDVLSLNVNNVSERWWISKRLFTDRIIIDS